MIRALDGVSLDIPAGQVLVVTGPNGGGKTTLLRVLSCSQLPEQGEVLIGGKAVSRLGPADLSKAVFHVNQDPLAGSVPTMTVFENLFLADEDARLQHLHRTALTARYRSMLEPLNLAGRLDQQAKTLSAGQKQILTILIARLRPAKLLLMDEPVANLDPSNAATCLALVRDLKSQGKTLLYVTHDLRQVDSFCDRIVTVKNGRIVGDTAANQAEE
jgi:ABC-type sugar transport system ATPase subunit